MVHFLSLLLHYVPWNFWSEISFESFVFTKPIWKGLGYVYNPWNKKCNLHLPPFFCRKVCFSKAEIFVETRIEISENKAIISFRRSIEHFCRFEYKKKRSPSAGLTFQGSLKLAPVSEKDATMTSPGFNSKTFDIFQSNFSTQPSSAKI